MRHALELRTTINATPAFFRRIHYMAASLAALGESLADHEIVVSVGSDTPQENLYRTQPWSNRYPITWRWVDPSSYAEHGYRATNRDRALHMANADYVMMVDADVIFVDSFSGLLGELRQAPAICGVMAHYSPFLSPPRLVSSAATMREAGSTKTRLDDYDYWQILAESFAIDRLPLDYELSGWRGAGHPEAFAHAPAYFNGGMVIGPVDLMDEMCRLFPAAEEAIDRVMEPSFFRPQAARTLAVYKAKLPHRALPLRYNFPNDPDFEVAYPDELQALCILHYLRTTIVHRDDDFSTNQRVATLIERSDLAGSNEALRRRLADLHSRVSDEESIR